jgi:hypothetical protein
MGEPRLSLPCHLLFERTKTRAVFRRIAKSNSFAMRWGRRRAKEKNFLLLHACLVFFLQAYFPFLLRRHRFSFSEKPRWFFSAPKILQRILVRLKRKARPSNSGHSHFSRFMRVCFLFFF